MSITRRQVCSVTTALVSLGLGGCLGQQGDDDATGSNDDEWEWSGTVPVDTVTQYHDPACGCCSEYVDYLRAHGFEVRVEEVEDLGAVKTELSVPEDLRSCHTIEFGEYLVEGHVPLEAVEALFDDGPDVAGIAIPGMPQDSPGMGPRGDPLTVYAFEPAGEGYEYLTV